MKYYYITYIYDNSFNCIDTKWYPSWTVCKCKGEFLLLSAMEKEELRIGCLSRNNELIVQNWKEITKQQYNELKPLSEK